MKTKKADITTIYGIGKTLFFSLIIWCMNSCFCSVEYDKFTIPKEKFTTNELRTNGYYHSGCRVLIFYKNGILRDGSCIAYPDPIIDGKREIKEGDDSNNRKKSWGLFLINNDKIVFEKYYSSECRQPIFQNRGFIIDDSTFVITEMQKSGSSKISQVDYIYKFVQFHIKPDSSDASL